MYIIMYVLRCSPFGMYSSGWSSFSFVFKSVSTSVTKEQQYFASSLLSTLVKETDWNKSELSFARENKNRTLLVP